MKIEHRWVVMPVFNGRAMVEKAVKSIREQDIPTRLFIINNASTDGAAQFLSTLPSDVATVVHYVPQKGVSYAWNRALEYVFNVQKQPFALVVNSDVVLRPDAYRRLIEDGGEFVTCVGNGDAKCVEPPFDPPDPGRKRSHPDFSNYLIRRSVWDRIGKFDERFFNYCGDGNFHIRMHQAGIKAYCIDLPFYHVASGTTKVADEMVRKKLALIADRDRQTFADLHGFKMGSEEYYAVFGGGRPDDPGAARD